MNTIVEINENKIQITWDKEIQKGTFIFVYAPVINEAVAAVQLFLDQSGLHKFWYCNEITKEWHPNELTNELSGWKFEIRNAVEEDWKGWHRNVILAITTPNDRYKSN